MPHPRLPRLLVLDSGLGGLTVLRSLRQAAPEAIIFYLADDAGFPYGALSDNELVARLCAVMRDPVDAFAPDAIVIACNTASTIALPALRAAFQPPIIGTVPAIKPAALLSQSGLVSVLGTAGTVSRDYTRALIADYGQGKAFNLVGAAGLADLVEADMAGGIAPDAKIAARIAPCFIEAEGRRTDVVVLACTHYPLIQHRLERLAPWPVSWLDPSPAIARRTANVLAEAGLPVGVGSPRGGNRISFTSRKSPSTGVAKLLSAFGLDAVHSESVSAD
ncbi:MAG: glutamate racemase [Rhodomicrobiaceae bacterium]